MRRREKELRCFCKSEPLLATYGVDRRGKLFVHIKVYKQKKIYSESVHMDGIVKIRCRVCLRWHRVNIVGNEADLVPTKRPETLPRETPVAVLDGPPD